MSRAGVQVVGRDLGFYGRDGNLALRITESGDIAFAKGIEPSQAAADFIDAVGTVTRAFGWDASTTAVNRSNAAMDALAAALGDTYVCTRVWEAWSVGTMSQDDFTPLAEADELLRDILGEVLAALGARATVPPIPLPPEEVNALPERSREYVMWLHTNADPAGTIQDNYRLTQENAQLRALLAERMAAEPVAAIEDDASIDAMVRRIDVALNGKLGAAPQAQLADIVGQCESEVRRRGAPVLAGFPRAPLTDDERSMMAWLERKGGDKVSITPLDIADFELAGWSSARAHHVLTALRSRALVECPENCEGRVSILIPERSP